MPMVDANQFYFNKDYVHAKNERVYMVADHPSILDIL
jgi:hypothetical protein